MCLLGALPAYASSGADSRLVQAVKGDDHAALKRLLAAHANVNAPLPDKSTVLAWAVDRQDVEAVHMLLAAGAKPNVTDVEGASPMTLACELGNPEIVTSLLKSGGDANAARADGIAALALCAGTSTPAALDALVAKGAKVEAADPQGQTALMRAAFKGRTDNIKFLLAHGANRQRGLGQGLYAAVLRAAQQGAVGAHGVAGCAAPNSKMTLPDGTSVVAAAVANDNVPFAVTAVSHGTDLTQHDYQGRQLIHVAAASGNAELVKMVLSKGVDPNAMSLPQSRTAAARAAGRRRGQKLARADGTRPPPPLSPAKTPLIFAAEAGSAPAMKALVDAGAKASIAAPDGTTVALAAAGSGNLDAVKYALQLDPKLTYIGPEHRSIMHYAIANKNPDLAIPVLQYLADKGAKLDEKNDKGDTPGDFINRGGQQDIRIFYIQLLKDHGIVSKHDH